MRAFRLAGFMLSLSLVVFVVLPLYAMAITLAIRSSIFDWSDKSISADEYKALWTFLAAGLTATVTAMGLLLTRSHNQRTLALQKDIEDRRIKTQEDTDKRLALDTAVKTLELVGSPEGSYAPSARIAGALATLVHLGHPIIAMRTLDSAWDANVVDSATGCWLVGEVFVDENASNASMTEAARILCSHANELCREEPGQYEWPSVIYEDWPSRVPLEARYFNLLSLITVLLSRDKAWWGRTYNWIVVLLYVIVMRDEDQAMRSSAAKILRPLLAGHHGIQYSSFFLNLKGKDLTIAEMMDEVDKLGQADTSIDAVVRQVEQIEAWVASD
jgi:hypothetical protein